MSRDVTTWRQVYPGEKSEKVINGCCRHFVASGVPGQPDTFLTTILFLFHCLWNADEKIFRTENNVEEWFRSDRKLGCVIKHQFPSLSLSSTPPFSFAPRCQSVCVDGHYCLYILVLFMCYLLRASLFVYKVFSSH